MSEHFSVEQLLSFARGDLGAKAVTRVEAHLDACMECADFLEMLKDPSRNASAKSSLGDEERSSILRRALELPAVIQPNPLVVELMTAVNPQWEEFLDTVVTFFGPVANDAIAAGRQAKVAVRYFDASTLARVSFTEEDGDRHDPRIALLARGLAQREDQNARYAAAALVYEWGDKDLARETRGWLPESDATAVRLRLCFAAREQLGNPIADCLGLLDKLTGSRNSRLRARIESGKWRFRDVMGKTPAAFATRAITDAAAATIDR